VTSTVAAGHLPAHPVDRCFERAGFWCLSLMDRGGRARPGFRRRQKRKCAVPAGTSVVIAAVRPSGYALT
jgi:hypothetical protein